MSETVEQLEAEADRAAATGNVAQATALLEQAAASEPQRLGVWLKLSAMRRARRDLSGSLEALERALAIQPLDFSALLSRAYLLEQMGDPRAGEAFAIAVAQAPDDEAGLPPPLAKALERAREKSARHEADVQGRLMRAMPSAIAGPERARAERFVSNTARVTRHYHQEPTHFHYPGLPEVEFHPREHFPELAILESAAGAIRSEFEALIASEAAELVPYVQYSEHVPLRQWKDLNFSRDWTAIHLLRNGERVEANARHCPKALAALARLPQPQIPGASPNAMFSLLAPRTRIPPHTGVANTRLVAHLALVVPPGCAFRVGATTREWREGEAFVFDDTIEHEAWNDSDQLRVVMIFDLWPPALSAPEREAVARIIPAAGVSSFGGM